MQSDNQVDPVSISVSVILDASVDKKTRQRSKMKKKYLNGCCKVCALQAPTATAERARSISSHHAQTIYNKQLLSTDLLHMSD